MQNVMLIIQTESGNWIIEYHTTIAEAMFSIDILRNDGVKGGAMILKPEDKEVAMTAAEWRVIAGNIKL